MEPTIVCDRCGTPCAERGWTAINRDGRTLTLCHVHIRDHRDALVKQGWTLVELAVLAESDTVPAAAASDWWGGGEL